ncbi:hypothetical protein HETIRDRAFT_324841 [Heterobasidion irregulare TC 32-1]|uniref:Uncharacterized protein n=1 Tax=Heterobasidion irregulare (strain TC 32-1) TaxID=747525 RepID=W4JW12_HETIT|nr:uncharacterized protein HETIRDRAFT_324841 [Heterobasidion irregulare TC 32-1]ETW77748.1 hypothetical protein HETIRDRAFT_324841 [Heterobasidion irregulare TC 32-1]
MLASLCRAPFSPPRQVCNSDRIPKRSDSVLSHISPSALQRASLPRKKRHHISVRPMPNAQNLWSPEPEHGHLSVLHPHFSRISV